MLISLVSLQTPRDLGVECFPLRWGGIITLILFQYNKRSILKFAPAHLFHFFRNKMQNESLSSPCVVFRRFSRIPPNFLTVSNLPIKLHTAIKTQIILTVYLPFDQLLLLYLVYHLASPERLSPFR